MVYIGFLVIFVQNTRSIFYITQNYINYLYIFIIFTINNIINSHTYTKIHSHNSNFNFSLYPNN